MYYILIPLTLLEMVEYCTWSWIYQLIGPSKCTIGMLVFQPKSREVGHMYPCHNIVEKSITFFAGCN